MNKHAFLAGLLAAFTGAAMAQSSVTAFGVVDVSARQVKNGSTKLYQVASDGYSSSRFGFRGVEDLGGGLSAGFWLEAALNPDDGTINSSGKFWHRRATVTLESGTLGELRIGRDYNPTYTVMNDFDPFGDNGLAKITNLLSKLTGTVNTTTRADNQIQYFLPKGIGGVYGELSVAPGEGVVGNKYVGGRLGYAAGGLNATVSYGQTDATGAEDKYKLAVVGLAYDFGMVRPLLVLSQAKFLDIKQTLLIAGVHVPVGDGVIRASVGKANLSGGLTATATADADDATLLALGYVHNLSKRTALYGTAARTTNKGAQRFAVATTPTIGAGQKSTGVEFGLRHSF